MDVARGERTGLRKPVWAFRSIEGSNPPSPPPPLRWDRRPDVRMAAIRAPGDFGSVEAVPRSRRRSRAPRRSHTNVVNNALRRIRGEAGGRAGSTVRAPAPHTAAA